MLAPSRSLAAAMRAGALLVVSAGCTSSTGGAPGTPAQGGTTSPAPSAAAISRFEVPASIDCQSGHTSASFPVSYATTGAKTVVISVDGLPVPGSDAVSADLTAQVHCDPLPHQVVIVAADANDRQVDQQKVLATNVPGASASTVTAPPGH